MRKKQAGRALPGVMLTLLVEYKTARGRVLERAAVPARLWRGTFWPVPAHKRFPAETLRAGDAAVVTYTWREAGFRWTLPQSLTTHLRGVYWFQWPKRPLAFIERAEPIRR